MLVADRKTDPTRGVHTTGIFVRRTLESFSLPETCLGPPIRRVTMFSPSGRRSTFQSHHDEFRIGRMAALYGRELEAATAAGANWAAGQTFEGIDCLHRDTLVELRSQDGRARIVRARFLVGADGTFSPVARALRLDRNTEWLVATEVVLPGSALDCEPQLMCFLDPRLAPGYIGWVAHDGHETHIGVGGLAGTLRACAQPLGIFRRKAAAILARHGVLDDTAALIAAGSERRGGCIPIGGMLRRVAGTRGLLVGDAAGAPSPLTAGGLDPCFRLSMRGGRGDRRPFGARRPTPFGGLLRRPVPPAVHDRACSCVVRSLPSTIRDWSKPSASRCGSSPDRRSPAVFSSVPTPFLESRAKPRP